MHVVRKSIAQTAAQLIHLVVHHVVESLVTTTAEDYGPCVWDNIRGIQLSSYSGGPKLIAEGTLRKPMAIASGRKECACSTAARR
jgi:hypothetical protein